MNEEATSRAIAIQEKMSHPQTFHHTAMSKTNKFAASAAWDSTGLKSLTDPTKRHRYVGVLPHVTSARAQTSSPPSPISPC